MQYCWLNKKNNKKLIVFFCGWSFDEKPFEGLQCNDNNVVVIYNYKTIEKLVDIFEGYEKYYLISWSMGVYIAYLLRDSLPLFEKKIAINGTPFPVDNELGISIKTFELTLKYVDSGLKGKFQQNLFKAHDDYEKYLTSPVARSIENRAEELISLDTFIKGREVEYSKFYDCAIVSDTDKIIPTRNQVRCWEKFDTPIAMMDSGHFPFYEFTSWNEILDKCK